MKKNLIKRNVSYSIAKWLINQDKFSHASELRVKLNLKFPGNALQHPINRTVYSIARLKLTQCEEPEDESRGNKLVVSVLR